MFVEINKRQREPLHPYDDQPLALSQQCWLKYRTPNHLMLSEMDKCQRETVKSHQPQPLVWSKHSQWTKKGTMSPDPYSNSRFPRAVKLLSCSAILLQKIIGSEYKFQSNRPQQCGGQTVLVNIPDSISLDLTGDE